MDVSPRLHEDADTVSDRLEVEHKLLLRCEGEQGWAVAADVVPSMRQAGEQYLRADPAVWNGARSSIFLPPPPPCPRSHAFLLAHPAAHWVKAPAVLLLHHNGRGLELEVDPTSLPEGLHYTGEPSQAEPHPETRQPLGTLTSAAAVSPCKVHTTML